MSLSEPPSMPPRGSTGGGNRLKMALVASLAVNLLVAGLALGLVLAGVNSDGAGSGGRAEKNRRAGPDIAALPGSERARLPAGVLSPRALLAALPPERRAPLVAGFRDTLATHGALGDEARAARMAAIGALRADPFDPAAAEAALTAWRAKQDEVLALSHLFLVDIAATMSAEERAAALAKAGRANAGNGRPSVPGDGSLLRRLREFRGDGAAPPPPGSGSGPETLPESRPAPE